MAFEKSEWPLQWLTEKLKMGLPKVNNYQHLGVTSFALTNDETTETRKEVNQFELVFTLVPLKIKLKTVYLLFILGEIRFFFLVVGRS